MRCEERVYPRGGSTFDRIVGRLCRNPALYVVRQGRSTVTVCARHARRYAGKVRLGG